jgi:hypothetical protein
MPLRNESPQKREAQMQKPTISHRQRFQKLQSDLRLALLALTVLKLAISIVLMILR